MRATGADSPPTSEQAVSEASRLFADLVETMQGLGYPADATETAVRRAARGIGFDAEILVLQSAVMISLRRDGEHASVLRRLSLDFRYRLQLVRDLDELVEALARGVVAVDVAIASLRGIRDRSRHASVAVFLAGSAIYSAATAARLGGAWREMLVAAAVALAGRSLGLSPHRHVTSSLVRTFLVGFVGALVTLASASLGPPLHEPSALFGGVVLMVPAMVMTMAAHELGRGLLETGAMRLAYALLRFVMLAAGVAAAVRVATVAGLTAPSGPPHALPWWVELPILATGGLGLTASLQASYRDAPWIVGAVFLAVLVQRASEAALGEGAAAPFVSAFVVGAAARLFARAEGRVAAIVTIPGLLQLVPGFMGTRAVFELLSGAAPAAEETLLRVLLVTVQLAAGLALATALFRPRREREDPAAA